MVGCFTTRWLSPSKTTLTAREGTRSWPEDLRNRAALQSASQPEVKRGPGRLRKEPVAPLAGRASERYRVRNFTPAELGEVRRGRRGASECSQRRSGEPAVTAR
jgi:hypothetical protein